MLHEVKGLHLNLSKLDPIEIMVEVQEHCTTPYDLFKAYLVKDSTIEATGPSYLEALGKLVDLLSDNGNQGIKVICL